MSGLEVAPQFLPLIPAKAGIQGVICNRERARLWFPACAGVSGGKVLNFNPFRAFRSRNPEAHPKP